MARRGYPPEFRKRVIELVEAGKKVAEGGRIVSGSCSATPHTWEKRISGPWTGPFRRYGSVGRLCAFPSPIL